MCSADAYPGGHPSLAAPAILAHSLHVWIISILPATPPYLTFYQDTEFPGVVAKPISNFKSSGDYHYQTIRTNVDLLKIIQLGLTLSNEKGELAPNVCTYQFNFKFSLETDIYAQDSIDLLTRSGIDFKRCAERVGIHVTCFPRDFQLQRHSRHEEHGIDIHEFAELLMCSGVVLCDDVHWVTFHSGYDFGYILKLLTCKPLPADEDEFFAELLLYCPHVSMCSSNSRCSPYCHGSLGPLVPFSTPSLHFNFLDGPIFYLALHV